ETSRRCEKVLYQMQVLLYCNFPHFKSVLFQKLAWAEHKRECKCLRSVYPKIPADMARLVARIIFKSLSASPCSSEELYSISELQSHIKEMNEEMIEGLRHLTAMLQFYMKEEIEDTSQLPPVVGQLFIGMAGNA
uniref:Uncharacterized protein n=1 Tax=Callorhinchus milii TaxID=7868 RepID=A0A4W3JU22_CALMI